MKKSLRRLLTAIEGVGRRVSAEVLQENVCEKGKQIIIRYEQRVFRDWRK